MAGLLQIYAIQKIWRQQIVARIGASDGVELATDATTGFLYIPSCPGTPTGTPEAQGDLVPMVVDSTNNRLLFYSGGAWRAVGLP